MSRVIVTSWLSFFSRLTNVQLPPAVHEVRGMESPEMQSRAWMIAVHHDHHVVDAVAGSEFLDDRIRLGE